MAGKLKLTQVKSPAGSSRKQREALRTLGLGRIGKTAERPDDAAARGQLGHHGSHFLGGFGVENGPLRAGGGVGEGVGEAVNGLWGLSGGAQDPQALAVGGGGQPAAEPVGVLDPIAVLGQPQPGHLHRIHGVGLLQPQ